ncbi:MAG: hypothetical protein JRF63_10780, partial [Deltaproteobacteria bacterium]|nr:hypothetical protein [Deltaproteobacteria bacterium]
SKDPLGDIKRHIDTAATRSQVAVTLIDAVIAEGRNPKDDEALIIAVESVESEMNDARHLIRLYKP